MLIRDERPSDILAISCLLQRAFKDVTHSQNTEHKIVNALRDAGALAYSLVAIKNDLVVGYVALSKVELSSGDEGWYGLGPVAVDPQFQAQGIGAALIEMALSKLKQHGAAGCVLLGEPDYYSRFGFKAVAQLSLADVPAEYFQILNLASSPSTAHIPTAQVFYHPAFYIE